MQHIRRFTVAAVTLLILSICLWERQPYAQEQLREDSEQTFDEEDLLPDSPSVTPGDEFADEDDAGEERRNPSYEREESFSRRDSHIPSSVPSEEDDATLLSSDPNASLGEDSAEEPRVVTSGPPALPGLNSLLPQEQVAMSFVVAGVDAMDKEDLARARTLFERAIEIAPLQPYSYFFLGRLALTQREHQKALPLLRKADILLTRGDKAWRSEAVSTQGAVYEDLGEIPQARRTYRRSLQLFPQNLRAMSALARLAEEEPNSDDIISQ